jgi:hypothetical protein
MVRDPGTKGFWAANVAVARDQRDQLSRGDETRGVRAT